MAAVTARKLTVVYNLSNGGTMTVSLADCKEAANLTEAAVKAYTSAVVACNFYSLTRGGNPVTVVSARKANVVETTTTPIFDDSVAA